MAKGIFWYIRERDFVVIRTERRAYRHVGMGWTKSGEGYLLCQKRQTLEGKEAMLCGDVCKYLQTFEAKDANVWGKGCNALRLRRAKLALKSSVLYWISEKGGADTPLTSHCSPSDVSGDSWFHFVQGEIHKNSNPQILERFQNRDIPNVWMPSVCCASVQRLRISSSYHSGDVSVPQGVNWNDLDQLLCSHP